MKKTQNNLSSADFLTIFLRGPELVRLAKWSCRDLFLILQISQYQSLRVHNSLFILFFSEPLRLSSFVRSPRDETVIIRLRSLSAYHRLDFPELNGIIFRESSNTLVSFYGQLPIHQILSYLIFHQQSLPHNIQRHDSLYQKGSQILV